ncbi:hypothetical protein ISE1_1511 [plant metagenome]|uniref:Uncharacterized protein n=1 Tax=plant metagenome TaxID=1297885 RepID=A0A484URD2_9ZZZZ
MKKRQKSNPQFYHPPPSSPDAQNQCAKINLKRLICRSTVTQAKCGPFAAGPPQGKRRPLGGQQAEGAAWGSPFRSRKPM